ncbi:hypothetical protein [Pseudotamlana carrageenivorans]|uniref:Uncharacterized protein n=1 Tax=Pseudotamlana carrageenivorans TaxID=2069432 RepID=A0A2I7SMD7_9FLAO|nr:hypothetical protein [Tamlana carrageenivorans]AUS07034.1 hypothetical protein C1A40_16990 [Tamlana carrageenivorans]
MENGKLQKLKDLVQSQADYALELSLSDNQSGFSCTGMGKHLEFLLNSRNHEINFLLSEIAKEQLKDQKKTPEPPDFTKYIRYSSTLLSHKEVFVGDKWVLVPNDACVDFKTTSLSRQRAFSVTISHGSNYATFTSTEHLKSYQEQNKALYGHDISIQLEDDYISKEEHDWMNLASQAYGATKKHTGGLDNLTELYNRIPKEFKRSYAYKISKLTKKVGKPAKAGKIFQGTEKVMGKVGKIAKVGPYLSAGTIGYELITDSWDAHTAVDGTLLVVGVVATLVGGAPLIVVGIAIYGILDYAFCISEGLDREFGRNSDIWNKNSVLNFPRQSTPLFNEVKIDNTYVAPKFKY